MHELTGMSFALVNPAPSKQPTNREIGELIAPLFWLVVVILVVRGSLKRRAARAAMTPEERQLDDQNILLRKIERNTRRRY